jgi:putative effector of murein hydrolase LrgA (UPF0299 family)
MEEIKMNRKKLYIMISTHIIVLLAYALITEFTYSWLNDILPGVVIASAILLIIEAVLAIKCVKRENEEKV